MLCSLSTICLLFLIAQFPNDGNGLRGDGRALGHDRDETGRCHHHDKDERKGERKVDICDTSCKAKKSGDKVFRTRTIKESQWPNYQNRGKNNFLLGSCEDRCSELCSDENFCTNDIVQDSEECKCDKDHPTINLNSGEKCCAPLGIIIPDDEECCTFGDGIFCDKSLEDCLTTLFSFQFQFHLTVFGEQTPNEEHPTVPLYIIPAAAEGIQFEASDSYVATTLSGTPFNFTVREIIKTSAELTDDFVNPIVPQELIDLINGLEYNEDFEVLLLEDLAAPVETEELQALSDEEDLSTLFLGTLEDGSNPFLGLVITYIDLDCVRKGFLFVVGDPSLYYGDDDAIDNEDLSRHRRREVELSCSDAFEAAEAAFPCPEDGELKTDTVCRTIIIAACETDVERAREIYNAAVKAAEVAMAAGKAALLVWKARQYRLVLRSCTKLRHPVAILICYAGGVATIEIQAAAKRKLLEEALRLAKEAALRNLDTLIAAAVDVLEGAANACFQCEGCPNCEGPDRTCCGDECIGQDECCPACNGEEQCCEGRCVSQGECCPACTGGEQCCEGRCIAPDECCSAEDPCCDSDDPCCGSDDPCCGSDDPCCGSFDPCCGQAGCGGVGGDPHIITFDRFRYTCQGRGEFVLTKSGNMEMHARFRKISSRVSVASGLAVTEGPSSTLVEISLPGDGSTGDPAVVLINGSPLDPIPPQFQDENVVVVDGAIRGAGTGPFRITFKTSLLTIRISSFLSVFNVRVGLPTSYRGLGTVGLLGSADDNSGNDWMAVNGTELPTPVERAQRFGRPALEYCQVNWCIRTAEESLFTYYDPEYSFGNFSGCDDELVDGVDVSQASPELRQLCGLDQACLIDGIVLGLDAAQRILDEQEAAFLNTAFRVRPPSIEVGRTFNVAFTVDLDDSAMGNSRSPQEYVLYRLDPVSGRPGASPVLRLLDTGSGRGDDDTANDLIYSNVIAVISEEAGEEIGFRAVPVFDDGLEDDNSPLVFTRLAAIRSYSSESGIGGDGACGCADNGNGDDDGDPCTIDSCDAETSECRRNDPIACGIGETCDPFTGLCQDSQNLVPCVAVIDEWDSVDYADEWATFRARYPQRPFCLLVPDDGVDTLPTGFDGDTVNNPDGIDRTIATTVNRDNGGEASASDWFDLCGLDRLSPSSIRFVGLFIDTSGSMTLGTVRASYDQFLIDLDVAGLRYAQVFNSREQWVRPFLAALAPS